ncbi:MAG TPA: hypothetical protein VLW51_00125 [Solirubrobacteraceae bacterium]|nr:hypothetical protein [Solirubrobacteraceae bacterium]
MRWATASSRGSSAPAPFPPALAELDDAEPPVRDARVLLALPPLDDAVLRVVRFAPVDFVALERLV